MLEIGHLDGVDAFGPFVMNDKLLSRAVTNRHMPLDVLDILLEGEISIVICIVQRSYAREPFL